MKHMTTTEFLGGTSLAGYITATREQIEAVFGKPMEFGEGDKVTTEWGIIFEDGTLATIYDWKRYEQGAPELNENYEWHIGGLNANAVKAVGEAMSMTAREFAL